MNTISHGMKMKIGKWIYRKRQFTLVELLVVMSIIMILAGLLGPALTTAREKARKITCASNLRQIGLSLRTYSTDYDSAAPPFLYSNHHLSHACYAYIGGKWDGMGLLWELDYLTNPGTLYCASNAQTQFESSDYTLTAAGTVMSSYIYRDPDFSYWDSCSPATDWNGGHWHASDCALVVDAFGSRENHNAHKNGFNILFGDGHVKWFHYPLEQQVQETENKDTHWSCCNATMARGWVPLDDLDS